MLQDPEKDETVSLGKAAGIMNEMNQLGVKRWILRVERRREYGGWSEGFSNSSHGEQC